MYIKNRNYKPVDLKEFEADPTSFEEATITCICMFQDLSTEFIDKMGQYLNWKTVCEYQFEKLTPEIIRKYADKIHWKLLFSKLGKLDEYWVRSICDIEGFNWSAALEYGRYSKKFIEDYSDKWNWTDVWNTQCFGTEFVEKHLDKLKDKYDWKCISINCQLTPEFIIKYRKKLCWECIIENQHLDREVIAKCSSFINFNILLNDEEAAGHFDRSEETLRLIFSVALPSVKLENFYIWEGKLSLNFMREFIDRIDNRLIFSCIKFDKRNGSIVEEFKDFFDKHNRFVFTEALKYPHSLKYVYKFSELFDYWLLNNDSKYTIDKLCISCPEERAFIEQKKARWEVEYKRKRALRGFFI